MKFFLQFTIIGIMCLVGQVVASVLPFPFPASVIGMILLFTLMSFNVVKSSYIRETATWLYTNIALYFIPVIVKIILCWDVLKNVFFQVLFICLFTTVTTFVITAYTVRFVNKLMGGRKQ